MCLQDWDIYNIILTAIYLKKNQQIIIIIEKNERKYS